MDREGVVMGGYKKQAVGARGASQAVVSSHTAHGSVAVGDVRFNVLPADVADVLERARAISEKYMPEGSSASPRIRAWYRNFLAGKFDSAVMFEHPDNPLPDEMFEDNPENAAVTGGSAMDSGIDIDISGAVEERIREIDEKGTYVF
jgi:hypothetical protein